MKKEKLRYVCEKCYSTYKWKKDLLRHVKYECGVERQYECSRCSFKFKRKYHLTRHFKDVHHSLEIISRHQ